MNSADDVQRRAPLRVLLLGGTGEAAEIAMHLKDRTDVVAISSLAGRVSEPHMPEGFVRIGGFGGVDGLIAYLRNEEMNLVIDATHPFAANISRNVETACRELGLPLIALARPQWAKSEADDWRAVPDVESAASYVNERGGNVFLAIGRQQIHVFAACGSIRLLIRAIDSPKDIPSNAQLILARGPFRVEHELQLLREHKVDFIVSKNSGGAATYAKIEAARMLGIPVVMIDRPQKHTVAMVESVEDVLASLKLLQAGGAFVHEGGAR